MSKRSGLRNRGSKTLKRSTLIGGVSIVLAFSIFLGITAGAIGLGSIYPQLNSIARPLACPGQAMRHAQQVSHIGATTYYTARWFCVDDTGQSTEVGVNTVALIAGTVYGLIIFLLLIAIVYLYWYSGIGPARNGGPELW